MAARGAEVPLTPGAGSLNAPAGTPLGGGLAPGRRVAGLNKAAALAATLPWAGSAAALSS
eukprot:CAMPEP_0175849682 /NCGR_PEP_ID=MMETSP0107_2-20121207/24653_1 /TAXON_ID=195067 ORGANISM="Goniomonas pacifica, Strain CCMP1869" /NCGR_SAMPLE_ID=MMETSP0107_2 /ASSEMBLY_ACC=CAM_ASM_000203 /LENGTH=59 /DNA_ID=CAMNT_0017164853 /DNA_START=127 /DNA_END=303 /DNA_ORIENTATION=+